MRKASVNVKLPMCDTLGFLRLSLVEGFHLAFVQRIWIICWKFYCMIEGINELLGMSTGYNIFDVKSATGLKTRWRIFFFFNEQFVQLQHNFENEFPLVSTILQHRERQQENRLFMPYSFPALSWRVALLWCDWCLLKGLEQRKLSFLLFSDLLRVEWDDSEGTARVLPTLQSGREGTR